MSLKHLGLRALRAARIGLATVGLFQFTVGAFLADAMPHPQPQDRRPRFIGHHAALSTPGHGVDYRCRERTQRPSVGSQVPKWSQAARALEQTTDHGLTWKWPLTCGVVRVRGRVRCVGTAGFEPTTP